MQAGHGAAVGRWAHAQQQPSVLRLCAGSCRGSRALAFGMGISGSEASGHDDFKGRDFSDLVTSSEGWCHKDGHVDTIFKVLRRDRSLTLTFSDGFSFVRLPVVRDDGILHDLRNNSTMVYGSKEG